MYPESIKSILCTGKGPLSREELGLGESIMNLEFAISKELNNCYLASNNDVNRQNSKLARITDELETALIIVQNANTKDERQLVYDILLKSGLFPQ